MKIEKIIRESLNSFSDDHLGASSNTPIREDAFEMENEEKISIIKNNIAEILHVLGMDLTDDSLKGTPSRVAKSM